MQPETEPEIIAKAAAGDTPAFRLLVEKHQGFVLALAFRLTGTQAEAEDIVQETFLRLWRNLSKYRREVKLRTWLYTITTNLCLDFLRSRRGKEKSNHLGLEKQLRLAVKETPESTAMGRELREVVIRLADRLTPKQRAIFVLRDLEELTMKEIGDILSMPARNVKSNLYYARLNVGTLIKQYYGEHEKK